MPRRRGRFCPSAAVDVEGRTPEKKLRRRYASFVRDWFRDAINFRDPQSAAFDALPSHRHRKLLARLDARAYVAALERAAAEGAVPASAGRYHPSDLHL